MCGIAGFVVSPGPEAQTLKARAEAMSATIRHRGPDSDGHWIDVAHGVALGHRRLAIVDLSPTGHQPMVSACGQYVISYNGEIYNAPELRNELKRVGREMRGTSDTEVLLEACAEWGVIGACEKLNGMFAFALWDRSGKTLALARDRLGIKPLYFSATRNELLFASELKPIMQAMGERPRLNHDALCAFMRHGYIPAPHSVFHDVHKLEPGTVCVFSGNRKVAEHKYWILEEAIASARGSHVEMDDQCAVQELDALLRDAVGRRMVADVPLGAFLSGGIDSSTVVALMQAQSPRPVRTFSIGFSEVSHDEAPHAAAVAKHLGTDHTQLYVEPQHAFDVIPRLADMYDEPFADSSQIPTFLVSELTRKHVTVSLSGDGGDELFAGYNRYTAGNTLLRSMSRVPMPLRKLAAWGVHRLSPREWTMLSRVIPANRRPAHFGSKLYKRADIVTSSPQALYRGLVSQWDDPSDAMLVGQEPRGILWSEQRPDCLRNEVEWMQYADTLTYLPDDILTKVDRSSMAVSLEARVPLLDHRVVEFAWRLPMHQKLRNNETKWLLRRVLDQYVPPALTERPKMGFGVPIGAWLRGPLQAWAEDLLDPASLAQDGILNAPVIRERWAEHTAGIRDWHYSLWNVLMLQAWRRRWAKDFDSL
jgi:asparagine synthase (glutamine-hydrolysing)